MKPEIHSSAIVAPSAVIEKGCSVGPFAIIEEDVILGENCMIEAQAIIKKGTVLDKNVQVGHFAVIGGNPQHLDFDPKVKSSVRIGSAVRLGEGVTIHRSIYSGKATYVGSNSFLMGYSHVGHDCNLEDNVILANGALLGGHVTIGSYTFIGGGAGIHQFVRIGEGVMVGGLSEVSKDVPPHVTISGRNRACGLNLVGMKRRGIKGDDANALKFVYRSILMKLGNPTVHAENLVKQDKVKNNPLALKFTEFFSKESRGFVKSKSSLK